MKSTFQVSSFDLSFSCNFVWQLSCFCLCFFITDFVTVTLRFVWIGLHFFLFDSWWVFGPVYVFSQSLICISISACLWLTFFVSFWKVLQVREVEFFYHTSISDSPVAIWWKTLFPLDFLDCHNSIISGSSFQIFGLPLPGNINWKIHYWFCHHHQFFRLWLCLSSFNKKKNPAFSWDR